MARERDETGGKRGTRLKYFEEDMVRCSTTACRLDSGLPAVPGKGLVKALRREPSAGASAPPPSSSSSDLAASPSNLSSRAPVRVRSPRTPLYEARRRG